MNLVIKNRDLLRNFKDLKEKLLSGEIDEIVVPQKSDFVIKIVVQKKDSSFNELLKKIKAKPIKNLKRPTKDII